MDTDGEKFRTAPRPGSFLATFTPRGHQGNPAHAALAWGKNTTIETDEYTVTLVCQEPDMLSTHPNGQQMLVLAGRIYRPASADSGQMLLDEYQQRGLNFLDHINGNFTLLLIDRHAGHIWLATDRANSSKLLVRWNGDECLVANDLSLLPLTNAPLDRTAIAVYLSMSYIYNRRTVFADVAVLDSASIYQLQNGALRQHKYWRFIFQPDHAASLEALSSAFGERLIEAVRVRLRPDRPTYVSLSGGYDAAGILSLLAESLRVPDVRCVTYAHGAMKPGSDEAVSAQLAAFYGYSHQVIPAFDGDLTRTLERNGQLGSSMTRPADEVDAWVHLGGLVDDTRPVMFTGTTHLHKPDWEIRSTADALASAHMFDFSLLSWLEGYLGRAAYRDYVAATRAEIDEALTQVPPTDDGWDLRDMLRYDQIHSRQALTWREYFTGRFFEPANPLLDDDLVDLLLRIPSSLRRNRRIYIHTITAMFPAQFAIPRATSSSYGTFWQDVIAQNKAVLRAFIQAESSPLDDIIAPDILLRLLDSDLDTFTQTNTRLWSAATYAYRLLKKVHWHRSPLVRPAYLHPAVSATTFLVRALTLRCFLTEFASRESSPAMLR